MTIKEAVIQSLDDIKGLANYQDIYKHIVAKEYYIFNKEAKTPDSTVSALLGDFIREGDSRVKRVKKAGGTYLYYLAKHEQIIGTDTLNQESVLQNNTQSNKEKTYDERDLHRLLASFLKSTDIYSKTIFHESSNNKDRNQIWTHPDMVGVKFLKLQTKTSQNFMKAINQVDTFKLSSFEIKKEINNDSELKAAFFQAVSNSSWANYGYLVAFEFSDTLFEEIERLNQAFGIGVIELHANAYRSRVLFQPKYRTLDFKTMDKLCKINKEFDKFIEHSEKLMTASEKYVEDAEKGFDNFCDTYFKKDTEMKQYCIEKKIPWDSEEE